VDDGVGCILWSGILAGGIAYLMTDSLAVGFLAWFFTMYLVAGVMKAHYQINPGEDQVPTYIKWRETYGRDDRH
jgi:hypothetical protein